MIHNQILIGMAWYILQIERCEVGRCNVDALGWDLIACAGELDNGDGLATHPNMHGTRKCIDSFHRHDKGLECSNVRKDISTKLSNLVDFSAKSNWTDDGLHNKKMCLCSSGGRIGKEKRCIASGKHHACYKVEADSEAKKRCRKKV